VFVFTNCSKEVQTEILTLSSSDSQTLSPENKSRGSTSARKGQKISMRNKQVS